MKNHKDENNMYNMASLQQEIVESQESNLNTQDTSSETCRKCKKSFDNEPELKKHLKIEHKTHRPCKNFSPIESENKCSYNEKM